MASLLRSVQFGIWLYTLIVVIARFILIESVFPCLAEAFMFQLMLNIRCCKNRFDNDSPHFVSSQYCVLGVGPNVRDHNDMTGLRFSN